MSEESLFQRIRRVAHLCFLILCLLALAVALWDYGHMWWYAWKQGLIPEAWNPPDAPHGPWRRLWAYLPEHPGRHCQRVQFDLLLASAAGILSFAFRPSVRRAIIPVLSVALCVLFFVTHSWLVD